MGKKLVLNDQIYNFSSDSERKMLTDRYQKYLGEKIKGFPSTKIIIKKLRKYDNRFEIEITGPEEVFVFNLIKREIGTVINFDEVQEGSISKGTMIDCGQVGFGIFVDCAIMNPKTDVLLPLHSLREQLCNGKHKSLSEIIKAYDFIDKFPIYVKIKVIDREEMKISGIIAQETLNLYKKCLRENIEGVFISGQSKGQVKKALIKTGHLRDIVSIERFGFLEHIVLLRRGTQSPGIISDIGNLLRRSKLSTIRPDRIDGLFNNGK
ncbi:MAG: DUF2110 family protein [Promethearchaeota archaeon]|nr:MAG: DUF2110 family protein [Candidatus Lokiarchaeota archaeon]